MKDARRLRGETREMWTTRDNTGRRIIKHVVGLKVLVEVAVKHWVKIERAFPWFSESTAFQPGRDV